MKTLELLIQILFVQTNLVMEFIAFCNSSVYCECVSNFLLAGYYLTCEHFY